MYKPYYIHDYQIYGNISIDLPQYKLLRYVSPSFRCYVVELTKNEAIILKLKYPEYFNFNELLDYIQITPVDISRYRYLVNALDELRPASLNHLDAEKNK